MRYLKLTIVFALLLLTGCFVLPTEDTPLPPPLAAIPEAQTLRTVTVNRGDVINDISVTANYVPAIEMRHVFSVGDLRFRGIYVAVGDYVEEGDILASLYWPEIEAQLDAATRQEEWLNLSLSQLERRQRLMRNLGLAQDTASYNMERGRILGELDIIAMELDFLARENDKRYLRASMDGTVSHVLFFNENMLASTTTNVVTIVDQTNSIFVARVQASNDQMVVGRYFEMTIRDEVFTAVVIDPVEHGVTRAATIFTEAYLMIVGDSPVFSGRVSADVNIVLDMAEDVLYVPTRAVHFASERVFVYVINEAGVRVLRDVEVGVRGNTTYEIISGLMEGEIVVV